MGGLISYRDFNGALTERTIWPISLGLVGNQRYVVGWCELRQGFRLFRIDRFAQANVRPERYLGRRRDLVKQWRLQVDNHAEEPENQGGAGTQHRPGSSKVEASIPLESKRPPLHWKYHRQQVRRRGPAALSRARSAYRCSVFEGQRAVFIAP